MNHNEMSSRREIPDLARRRLAILIMTGLLAIGTALGASSVAAGTGPGDGAAGHAPSQLITTHHVPAGAVSGQHPEGGPGADAVDCFEVRVEDCPEVAD